MQRDFWLSAVVSVVFKCTFLINKVLENFSDAPMTPKQILHVIQTKGLKEMRGTAPLACLVTMLHSQVRGDRVKNSIFFKLPGRMSLFTLKVHKPHPLKLSTLCC
uniref:ASXL transcriptional regulator 1 n=1 Tax=Sander lucioperca TaxID=283035 RepID=A0A8D0DEX0_SANLU